MFSLYKETGSARPKCPGFCPVVSGKVSQGHSLEAGCCTMDRNAVADAAGKKGSRQKGRAGYEQTLGAGRVRGTSREQGQAGKERTELSLEKSAGARRENLRHTQELQLCPGKRVKEDGPTNFILTVSPYLLFPM